MCRSRGPTLARRPNWTLERSVSHDRWSNRDPLDFIEADLIAPAIMELRGARRGMVRHPRLCAPRDPAVPTARANGSSHQRCAAPSSSMRARYSNDRFSSDTAPRHQPQRRFALCDPVLSRAEPRFGRGLRPDLGRSRQPSALRADDLRRLHQRLLTLNFAHRRAEGSGEYA